MKIKTRYWMAVFIILAYSGQFGKWQAGLMLFYALLILKDDFAQFRLNRFDISTAYAALLVLTCISHGLALFGLTDNPWFFTNVYSPEKANKAIFIFNLGSIVIMETMRRMLDKQLEKKEEMTKSIVNRFSFGTLFFFSVLLFLVSSNFNAVIHSFGSVGTFLLMMVNGSVLLLSFQAHYKNKNVLLVFCYTLFLSVWALQFSYLRMEILIPMIAYLGGDLLANRSLKKLHLFSKTLVIGSLVIFPPLFSYLGENRGNLTSSQKLEVSMQVIGENNEDEEGQTIMSRLSIIPQLSNIVMLTEKRGFYNGQTLGYLGYVFVPRFIWPDKPLIIQGQWFALEIGAAYKMKNGIANNSVNMTVPGEFYLNYGYPGVIIGCGLFGLFIAWLWNQTNYNTLYGWAFRFYLIFLGLFSLGADLQILPTLMAYWIIYRFVAFLISQKKTAALQPTTNLR